jgi:hypothetical protein
MHRKRILKAYYRELFGALALYGLLLLAIRFGRPLPEGPTRMAVLLGPMIGFAGAIWAIARRLRRADDYVRQRLPENVALAAALTAGLTFTYGFLETAGLSRLSMFSVWMVLCGGFGVVSLVRSLFER